MPALSNLQLATANKIYNAAIAAGVPHDKAIFVVAHSAFESNNWTSHVYTANNNGFGMRMPSKRKSPYILGPGTKPPANEGSTPYARYRSIEDSTRDLLHWFNYVHGNWNNYDTPEAYADWLKSKGYYTGSLAIYRDRVHDLVTQLEAFIKRNPGGIIGAGIVVLFLAWALFNN